MAIDRSKMRKGAEAIDQANEDNANRGDGTFTPFLSSIYWGDDGEERYVLILNPMEDIPQVDYHPFINLGDDRPHSIICRTDPIIGEAVDPIRSTWKYKPRLTNLAIAVVLEAEVKEDSKGRKKPVGFTVATRAFDRTILDADGKPTDEKEEVEAPEVGIIAQSPLNFFNQLRAFDASEAPLHTTPLKITRLGAKDVSYTVVGYDTITPDVSNLLDLIQNVSYVADPEALVAEVEEAEDDEAACIAIGQYLLDRRIDELGDADNYQKLFDQITEPSRYPEGGDKKKATKKATRPTRSSRRTPAAESSDSEPAEPTATAKEKREDRIAKLRNRTPTPA